MFARRFISKPATAVRAATTSGTSSGNAAFPIAFGIGTALVGYTALCYTRNNEQAAPVPIQQYRDTRDPKTKQEIARVTAGPAEKSVAHGNDVTNAKADPFRDHRNVKDPAAREAYAGKERSFYQGEGDMTRAEKLSLDGGSLGSRNGQAMSDRAKRIEREGA
jgi:hypothetical protein